MRPWPDRLRLPGHLAMIDAALARPWPSRSDRHAFVDDPHSPSAHPPRPPPLLQPHLPLDRAGLAAQAFGPDARRQTAALATLLAGRADAETAVAFLPVPRVLHGPTATALVVSDPARWQAAVVKWRLPDARDVRPPVLRRLPSSLLLPPLPGSAHDRIAAADAAVALLPGIGLALA